MIILILSNYLFNFTFYFLILKKIIIYFVSKYYFKFIFNGLNVLLLYYLNLINKLLN